MNDYEDLRKILNRPEPIETQAAYVLSGENIVEFAAKIIDPINSILGNRYLTRRSGMFLIAPSGQGKSTGVIQSTACWACGRQCFDIPACRPQRVTLIQAEDDDADLADMAKVIEYLELSPAERDLIAQNSWIETVNDKVGTAAVGVINEILTLRPCDLLILNPYTAFLGASIMDDEANSIFLRAEIQRLLNDHNCAVLIVHHTPKTNFRARTDKWSIMDWMYSGAGAAVLTNWARAVLAIDPVGESGVYKFIAAKRHQRLGWKENFFRHDPRPGVLLWTKATEGEVCQAKSGSTRRIALPTSKLLEFLPKIGSLGISELREKVMQSGVSRRAFDDAIQIGLETGKIAIESCNRGRVRWKNVSRREASQLDFGTNGQD